MDVEVGVWMWRKGGCGERVVDVDPGNTSATGVTLSTYSLALLSLLELLLLLELFFLLGLLYLRGLRILFTDTIHTRLFYFYCLKNYSYHKFLDVEGRVVDVEGGGLVDVEGGWIWRNLLISQYDHISAFSHCISLIFCMHQYFLKNVKCVFILSY